MSKSIAQEVQDEISEIIKKNQSDINDFTDLETKKQFEYFLVLGLMHGYISEGKLDHVDEIIKIDKYKNIIEELNINEEFAEIMLCNGSKMEDKDKGKESYGNFATLTLFMAYSYSLDPKKPEVYQNFLKLLDQQSHRIKPLLNKKITFTDEMLKFFKIDIKSLGEVDTMELIEKMKNYSSKHAKNATKLNHKDLNFWDNFTNSLNVISNKFDEISKMQSINSGSAPNTSTTTTNIPDASNTTNIPDTSNTTNLTTNTNPKIIFTIEEMNKLELLWVNSIIEIANASKNSNIDIFNKAVEKVINKTEFDSPKKEVLKETYDKFKLCIKDLDIKELTNMEKNANYFKIGGFISLATTLIFAIAEVHSRTKILGDNNVVDAIFSSLKSFTEKLGSAISIGKNLSGLAFTGLLASSAIGLFAIYHFASKSTEQKQKDKTAAHDKFNEILGKKAEIPQR